MRIAIRRKRHHERLWVIKATDGKYAGKQVGFIRHTFTPSYQVRNDLTLEKDRFFQTLLDAKLGAIIDFEETI